MAKIKFNASRSSVNTSKSLEKTLSSKKLEQDMGEVIVDRIAFEARRGTPLNDNRRFPELKESTIKRRAKSRDKKHPAFSPERSNLTRTGQLIDSLSFRRLRGLVFELFVDNTTRTPYLDEPQGSSKTNKQVDKRLRAGVGDPRRKFELFTAKGVQKERKIIDRIRELIKGELKRRL